MEKPVSQKEELIAALRSIESGLTDSQLDNLIAAELQDYSDYIKMIYLMPNALPPKQELYRIFSLMTFENDPYDDANANTAKTFVECLPSGLQVKFQGLYEKIQEFHENNTENKQSRTDYRSIEVGNVLKELSKDEIITLKKFVLLHKIALECWKHIFKCWDDFHNSGDDENICENCVESNLAHLPDELRNKLTRLNVKIKTIRKINNKTFIALKREQLNEIMTVLTTLNEQELTFLDDLVSLNKLARACYIYIYNSAPTKNESEATNKREGVTNNINSLPQDIRELFTRLYNKIDDLNSIQNIEFRVHAQIIEVMKVLRAMRPEQRGKLLEIVLNTRQSRIDQAVANGTRPVLDRARLKVKDAIKEIMISKPTDDESNGNPDRRASALRSDQMITAVDSRPGYNARTSRQLTLDTE